MGHKESMSTLILNIDRSLYDKSYFINSLINEEVRKKIQVKQDYFKESSTKKQIYHLATEKTPKNKDSTSKS